MTAVRTIGIMTGNSLDGVDIVLTGFENGRITDLGGFSKPYPLSLTEKMLRLRARIREEGGRMERLVEDGFSLEAIDEYTSLVAETVNTFCSVPVTAGKILPRSVFMVRPAIIFRHPLPAANPPIRFRSVMRGFWLT